MLVKISAKEEFRYRENEGCMVRVTKWTGRDSIPGIQIRPQIVTLDDESSMEIEIRNPFADKALFLQRQDKVACLSVLSGPAKPGFFNRDVSPESFETRDKRWFRVSSVVLHRKGTDHQSCIKMCFLLLYVAYYLKIINMFR